MTEVLQYYSPEVHKAAFVLPVFAEKEIASSRRRLMKEDAWTPEPMWNFGRSIFKIFMVWASNGRHLLLFVDGTIYVTKQTTLCFNKQIYLLEKKQEKRKRTSRLFWLANAVFVGSGGLRGLLVLETLRNSGAILSNTAYYTDTRVPGMQSYFALSVPVRDSAQSGNVLQKMAELFRNSPTEQYGTLMPAAPRIGRRTTGRAFLRNSSGPCRRCISAFTCLFFFFWAQTEGVLSQTSHLRVIYQVGVVFDTAPSNVVHGETPFDCFFLEQETNAPLTTALNKSLF